MIEPVEILAAYDQQPPTETLTVTWIEGDESRASTFVAWSDGGTHGSAVARSRGVET